MSATNTTNANIETRLIEKLASVLGVDMSKNKTRKRVFKALAVKFDGDHDRISEFVGGVMESLKDQDRQEALKATGVCQKHSYNGKWKAFNFRLKIAFRFAQEAIDERQRIPPTQQGHSKPFYRVIDASRLLGWEQLTNQVADEPCTWVLVGPNARCARIEDRLLVKDPDSWFDTNTLAGVSDLPEWLKPWLHLANKHKVLKFAAMWNRDPSKVSAWLQERKPSRKSLEKKLPKMVNLLPTHHDWSNRPVPQAIAHAGGWHCRNEEELRSLGTKHGWCFGSLYHGRYTANVEWGEEMFFVPHPRGLIAAHRRRGYWEEVQFPHNSDARGALEEIFEDHKSLFHSKAVEDRIWAEAQEYWDRTGY